MPRNTNIDIAKFVASLLVVAIHTELFRDVNGTLYFVFNEIICRLGVPFFAICSGYYLCVAFQNGGLNMLKKHERKLIKIYGLWTLLYFLFLLPNWVETGYLSFYNVIGFCKSSFLSGSYFHLWYVLHVIYALPIFFLIVRNLPSWSWILLAATLYCINSLNYGYSEFLPVEVAYFFTLFQKGYALVDAQFFLLPIMLCGAFETVREKENESKRGWSAFGVSFFLLVTEAYLLKTMGNIRGVSRIFMILPTAYLLFVNIKNLTFSDISFSKRLGEMSLVVYCLHPMLCWYICLFANTTVQAYILVSVLSIVVSCIIQIVKIKHF